MNDQTYMLILRILHVGFGIFWAGSVFYFTLFLIPALKSSGPEGMKFMQALGKTGYPTFLMIASVTSITAGILLIAKISGGFRPEWFSSLYAQIVTSGGVIAIIAFLIGISMNRPAAARIGRISETIAKQGTPPTPAQMAELGKMRQRIFNGTKYIAILLAISVITMSIFRYVS